MNDFRLVTVANRKPLEWYYTFDEFFKSAGNIEILLLGTKEGQYGGLGSKPRLLYNAIKNAEIKEKYLIFCDSFDIVFAKTAFHLFEQYKLWYPNIPIVISAEKNCFPATYKGEYDKMQYFSSYRYLNSGMIVGEVEAMLTVLEAMDAKNIPNDYWDYEKNEQINPNDQEYYQGIFLRQPVTMLLDHSQTLSNTLHQVEIDDLIFGEQGIMNKETNKLPCSFHFNGASKSGNLRTPILTHLKLL